MGDKDTSICFTPPDDLLFRALNNLGGEELKKTMQVACNAIEDGRYGYAGLMILKGDFHDIPMHQFSSGDMPKPANTPVVKAPETKLISK